MNTMDWKVLTILNIVLCVTARPPRTATSAQKFIKYISDNEEKINVGSEKSEHREEYVGSYPSYEFSYKVSDPHTHDFKGQEEKRHGDKVNGVYWLIEPDGRKRLVKYHANDEIGFDVLINYSQKGENVENEESNESDSNNNKEQEKKRTWHVIQDFKMKKNSKENAANEENNANNEEQENEGSQSNQEESAQEQSQENTNGQETTTGGNSAMNAVIEEVTEDNVEENNENGNESEAGATEDQSLNEDGEAENEENNETNVEQNSKQRQSGENNKKKERAYGYKTYIYHIRH